MSGITSISSTQGYLLPDIGFSSSCTVGTLVAQNPETGIYEPAAAEWSGRVRSDGSWIPSYKSYVRGVLVTPVVNNAATILCEGWSSNVDLIQALAPGGRVGDYFLTADGVATFGDAAVRELRIYCYSYLGDASGKIFIKPALPEYAGHAHNYVNIPISAWAPTGGSSASSPEATEGIPSSAYAYVYTDSNTLPELFAAVSSNPQYPCLVKNGTEVALSSWGIAYDQETGSDGMLQTVGAWVYVNFALEQNDVFSLHTITPLTANEPLVRSVSTTPANKLLRITNAGGKVFVDVNNTPVATDVYTGVGVNSITSEGIKTGPIIQGLRAGPGIQLSNYVDSSTHTVLHGVQVITATQFAGTMIDMNVCNLDRVVMGTAYNGVSYVFPQNATSMLIGTMRVPHFEAATAGGKLIFVFLGGSTGLQAYITVQQTPTLSEPTAASQVITRTVPATTGSASGLCYRSEIDLGTDILSGDALIVLKLVATSPAQAVTLISASLTLY